MRTHEKGCWEPQNVQCGPSCKIQLILAICLILTLINFSLVYWSFLDYISRILMAPNQVPLTKISDYVLSLITQLIKHLHGIYLELNYMGRIMGLKVIMKMVLIFKRITFTIIF